MRSVGEKRRKQQNLGGRNYPDYYQIVGAEQSAWEEDIRVDRPIIVRAGAELFENG